MDPPPARPSGAAAGPSSPVGLGLLARSLSSLRSFSGASSRLQLSLTQPIDQIQAPPAEAEAAAAEAGEGAAPPAWQEDVAASAEHHRLTNSVLSLDVRQAARSVERTLPFAGLLLLLFVWQHGLQLLAVGFAAFGLHRTNAVMRAQVALKQAMNRRALAAVAAASALQALLVCLLLRRDRIPAVLLLSRWQPVTQFFEVLFTVVAADSCLRLLAVIAKVGVLLSFPADCTEHTRRRGHVLTAVEYAAGVWRGLAPAPLWGRYFASGAGGAAPALGLILTAGYALLKVAGVAESAQLAAAAARQAAPGGWCHGTLVSAEEAAEAGNECSVCQDAPRSPMRLTACGHIYCADCIAEWLERDRADCPMCRALVVRTKVTSHGDGTTPLLPVLF